MALKLAASSKILHLGKPFQDEVEEWNPLFLLAKFYAISSVNTKKINGIVPRRQYGVAADKNNV